MYLNDTDDTGFLDDITTLWPLLTEPERADWVWQVELIAILDAIDKHERRVWVEQTEMVFPVVVGND